MIYVNKVLPVLLLPTGFSLLLLIIGLFWRKWAFCWAVLLVLWVCSTPLVGNWAMRAAEGWQLRQAVSDVAAADAIVVLSGALVTPPAADSTYEFNEAIDRFDGGLMLWKAQKAPRLIFTGTSVPWLPDAPSEGEILAARAMAMGVPLDRVVVTKTVANTAAEAQVVADFFREEFPDRDPVILLVTSAYHMRRAQLLFKQAGLEEVILFPVDFRVNEGEAFTILSLLPSARTLVLTETALREAYGYWFYRLLGR